MSVPKRHHYVPRMLLKRFVDSKGKLHLYSAVEKVGGVRSCKVEDAFVERHLYAEKDRDGTRNTWLEHELSVIEGLVDPIISKIVESATAGRNPKLTANERLVWDYFFVTQFKRVREFFLGENVSRRAHELFANVVAELRKKYPSRSAAIDEFEKDGQADLLVRNAQVRSVSGVSQRVMDALQSRGIAVLRVGPPSNAFVIGSRTVVQFGFADGLTLFDDATEMWLPVSSGIVVGVGSRAASEELHTLSDPEAVMHLNKAIAQRSTAFASRDSRLTDYLRRTR